MNFFKNLKLTVKIVLLVLTLQFVTMAIFTYVLTHEEEIRLRASIDDKLKTIAYAVNDFVLRKYHDKIIDKDSISEDEYMDLLVHLSNFASKVNVKYIYSFIQYKDHIVFTSTSATKKDFQNNNYELFFDAYKTPSKKLLQGFDKKDIMYEETNGKYGYLRTVFIPFTNKYGKSYIIGVDIKVDKIAKMYESNRIRGLQLAIIIFFVSAIITTLLILNFLKYIALIRNALQEFFDYLNYKRTSVSPVKIKSKDELGEMGHLINENIEIIAANVKKDNELIHEIANISEQVKLGIFSSQITIKADNPALNHVKDVMNEVFLNMQVVMLDILHVLEEFSQKNYSCKLDDYNLDGEMGKLIAEISVFTKNFSEYMLNKAYDSINLNQDSNSINKYIESLTERLYILIKQINEFKQTVENIKRFNTKGQGELQHIKDQKEYVDDLLQKLQDKIEQAVTNKNEMSQRETHEVSLEIHDIIDDILKRMDMIEVNRVEIFSFISKSLDSMNELSENFNIYENLIVGMKKSVDDMKKISSDLKILSKNMKTSIEESNFDGKENINMLMNSIER